jgi:hypothetical protein
VFDGEVHGETWDRESRNPAERLNAAAHSLRNEQASVSSAERISIIPAEKDATPDEEKADRSELQSACSGERDRLVLLVFIEQPVHVIFPLIVMIVVVTALGA